jgi:hypothetical protein
MTHLEGTPFCLGVKFTLKKRKAKINFKNKLKINYIYIYIYIIDLYLVVAKGNLSK